MPTILFESVAEVYCNLSSNDYFIMGGSSLAAIDVIGKSWTMQLDLWVSNWSSAHGQGLAVYGDHINSSGGSRLQIPHVMANLYFPSSGSPHIFLNDRNGDVVMSTVSGISSSTYFTLKIQFDTSLGKYSVYVNGNLQGSYVVIRDTQRFT